MAAVEPMSNAVVTASTLQAFADALPAWMDQRNNVALGQLVEQLMPVIDRHASEVVARTIEQMIPLVDQRAADIADAIIDQQRVSVDGDADRIRSEIVEAACAAIVSSLPQLVEAARAGSTSEVVRDREGRIRRIETKYD